MQVEEKLTLATLLRRYRRAAGLSQEALAERAGLSRRGIADLERGARLNPHPQTISRLARALGLDSEAQHKLAEVGFAGARRDRGSVPRAALGQGAQRSTSPASSRVHNLPVHLPTLIGRELCVAEVQRRVTRMTPCALQPQR